MAIKTVKFSDIDWRKLKETLAKHSPNLVTFFRLLLVPVFVVIMLDPTPVANLWATGIFIFASITDWLDGYLARTFKAESILGKLLDPLADKVLVLAALVMLVGGSVGPRVPAWMVVVILSREVIITGLRSLAALKGVVVPASNGAKHKTAFTMIAIIFLLIGEPYHILGVLVDFHFTGMVCLWVALILAVATGVQYFIDLKNLFAEEYL